MENLTELLATLRNALEMADRSGEHLIAAEISVPLFQLEERFVPPSSRGGD